jgi:hypothetical protein
MCFGYQLFPKIFWKKTQHDLAYQLFNGWRKEGQCDLVSNYSPTSFPKITMWFGLPIMQTAGERGSWRKEGLDPSKELLFYSIDIVFKKYCKIYLYCLMKRWLSATLLPTAVWFGVGQCSTPTSVSHCDYCYMILNEKYLYYEVVDLIEIYNFREFVWNSYYFLKNAKTTTTVSNYSSSLQCTC